MTSDRPYRCALPFSVAREEILRESARQFDPKMVEIFLTIPEGVLRQIMLHEKMRTTRVPSRASVTCIEKGRQHALKCVNLSEGGMLLEQDTGIPLGTEMEVQFELAHVRQPLKLNAEAIRRELPDRVAVAFRFAHPGDKGILQQYVARAVEPQVAALFRPAN